MSPIAEKRVLISLLKRIGGKELRWEERRWSGPIVWIAIAMSYFLLFRFGTLIVIRCCLVMGVPAIVASGVLLGAASCIAGARLEGAKA